MFERLPYGKTGKWNPVDHCLGSGANMIGREKVEDVLCRAYGAKWKVLTALCLFLWTESNRQGW